MAAEIRSLETGMLHSQTILMANSTVWRCLLEVHTLAHGETSTAPSSTLLSATMVSSVIV